MTVAELREILKDVRQEIPVCVNVVHIGKVPNPTYEVSSVEVYKDCIDLWVVT